MADIQLNLTGHSHDPQHNHPPHQVVPTVAQVVQREELFLHRKLLPDEVKEVQRRVSFMKGHQGHESQHAEMLLIMLAALVVSQILITLWKKYHIHSYNLATLVGLWIIPFMIAVHAGHARFIIVWLLFSVANGFIVKLALESPMKSMTPRLVYSWYSRVYDVACIVAGTGYFIVCIAFLHVLGNFT